MNSFSRLSSWIAGGVVGVMLVGASQSALAQVPCTIVANRVVQNGGAPCTVGGVTVSGTAITAINSANVTANGSVTATGFPSGGVSVSEDVSGASPR